jgi:UDPglucose 6-dehydrogenase
MMNKLNILITGGGSGIGSSIAIEMDSLGHNVIICGRRASKLKETAKGTQISYYKCDVSNESNVLKLKEKVLVNFLYLDIIINAAGIIGEFGTLEKINFKLWKKTININLFGTVLICKIFLPLLLKSKTKKIINFSGGGAFGNFPKFSAYAVSKASVVRFSENLSEELNDFNVKVNCIAPGFVKTEIHNDVLKRGKEIANKHYNSVKKKMNTGSIPIEKVLGCLKYLISEKSNHLSGKTISASFDKWDSDNFNNLIGEIQNSDLFTMRRINIKNLNNDENSFIKELNKSPIQKKSNLTIGFVGISHLGIVSSISTASLGYKVICYDKSEKLISDLINKKINVNEPYLDDMLAKYYNNITFTNDSSLISNCNIVYLTQDVPTDDYGKSDLRIINEYLKIIFKNLNKSSILVINSQISPGFTSNINYDLTKIYYQVETLVIGQAVNRFLNPERIVIGSENPNVPFPENYKKYLDSFDCQKINIKYESAELVKISINLLLSSNITIANFISEICENSNADYSEMILSLRLDRRIGKFSYITPGLGISGGNLERDLDSIIKLSDSNNINNNIVKNIIEYSSIRKNWVFDLFKKIQKNKTNLNVGILGISYKEDTNILKNSPSILLINQILKSFKNKIFAYDININNLKYLSNEIEDINGNFTLSQDKLDVLINSQILIIMNKSKENSNFSKTKFKMYCKDKIIIDPFNRIDRNLIDNLEYYTIGKNKQLS